jgi:hypothetical protein
MKRILLVLISLSVLVACAEGPATVSPRDAVLDAMAAVYEAGTFHQELKMSLSAEGMSFSISGEADVDNEHQKVDMTMDLGMLGGEMQLVMDGGIVYMRSPAFADAPTPWVSMDPEKMDPASHAVQFGGFGAGTTDPSAYAGLFAGVFDVKDSGQVEIQGISTTHYVGTIDLEKVMASFSDMMGEDVDPATKEQLEAAVKQFEALGIDQKIPFEIWIDGEGLPRRQAITMDFGDAVPGAEDAGLEMTVDYSAFGEPVHVRIPKRSQVTDVTDLMGGAASEDDSRSGAYG